MKMKNVNVTSTAMNTEEENGKKLDKPPHQPEILMIADLLFIFKLFKHLPESIPPENYQVMHLPALLAHNLPDSLLTKLDAWVVSGSIILSDFCDETLHDAISTALVPGLQLTEMMALLEARRRKQSIVACSGVMTKTAKKLGVPVFNNNLFPVLSAIAEKPVATSSTRVKKNNIILSGVPAPIAGNKLNNVYYEQY